jgi:TolB protein
MTGMIPYIMLAALLYTACGQQKTTEETGATTQDTLSLPGESHLRNIRQLTFDGENAEAYLSFDEQQLVLQRKSYDMECDQIFTMGIDGANLTRLSSGKGRTTCSYWLPDGEHLVFSSTEAHDPGCLPSPDRSKGYVWKLYPEFDIYKIRKDGTGLELLFASEGYDAEATVSPKGDRIVFTSTAMVTPKSTRWMLTGKNVKRLTSTKATMAAPSFPPMDRKSFFAQAGRKRPRISLHTRSWSRSIWCVRAILKFL